MPERRSHYRTNGTAGRSAERYRRRQPNAASQSEIVRQLRPTEKRVRGRGCGNDGWWTVRKPKSGFPLSAHEPLEIAAGFPTSPQPRLTTAMEKWKSNGRI